MCAEMWEVCVLHLDEGVPGWALRSHLVLMRPRRVESLFAKRGMERPPLAFQGRCLLPSRSAHSVPWAGVRLQLWKAIHSKHIAAVALACSCKGNFLLPVFMCYLILSHNSAWVERVARQTGLGWAACFRFSCRFFHSPNKCSALSLGST